MPTDASPPSTPRGKNVAAQTARERGEPAIRQVDRDADQAREGKREARRASLNARRRGVTLEAEAEVAPKAEKAPKAETAPKAEKAPEAELAPEAAEGAVSIDDIKLPKVGDLADFLNGFDNAADVAALQERDGRKTARVYYEARLAELTGGEGPSEGKGGDDA